MFSLIFFGFVAFILIVGFIITIKRKKSRSSLRSGDDSALDERSGINDPARRSGSAFNEVPPGRAKDGIVPAGSKLPQKDSGNRNEPAG